MTYVLAVVPKFDANPIQSGQCFELGFPKAFMHLYEANEIVHHVGISVLPGKMSSFFFTSGSKMVGVAL